MALVTGDDREALVIYTPLASNPFELAVLAALRTKQLIAGCVPRVVPADKLTSTARLEVLAGKVARLPLAGPES
jgi:DNA-directed RNA polymerase subunit K/omega